MNEQYKQLGVSDAVLTYGETILASLRERFDAIDAIAEANQLKVINAMQKNRVAANHFNLSTTPTASARRRRWFARRSPAAPTRWRWRWARTCCPATSFSALWARPTTRWRRSSASGNPSVP